MALAPDHQDWTTHVVVDSAPPPANVFGTAFGKAVRGIGDYVTAHSQGKANKGIQVNTVIYGPLGGAGVVSIWLHRISSDGAGDLIIASNSNQPVPAGGPFLCSITVYPGLINSAGGGTFVTLNDVLAGWFYLEMGVFGDVAEVLCEYELLA